MVVDELKVKRALGADMESAYGFLKPHVVAKPLKHLKMFRKLATQAR